MDRLGYTAMPEVQTGTISAELDRIEVSVGKIGLNQPEQAFSILYRLDEIDIRLQELEGSVSRKTLEAQLEGILGKIKSEARLFIRDLGGSQALVSAREKVNPPQDHWWWFLDAYLAEKRRASLRRSLIGLGIALAVLGILSVVYQLFFAPDPTVVAVFQSENSSRDLMSSGNYEEALNEVEKGLSVSPQDPSLLTMKGVLQDLMGQPEAAAATYALAEKEVEHEEDFYLLRGQTYLYANQMEKAFNDVQKAILINPKSAQAYLLSGQIHEILGQTQAALDDYDLAFTSAGENNQPELAALARTRTAMLLQSMNTQVTPPAWFVTPTSTP